MEELDLIIEENGDLSAIYSDRLTEVFALGHARIRRASNVEPDPRGGWFVDMAPVGGPELYDRGGKPFTQRAKALAAEVKWLRARMTQRKLDGE